MSKHQKRSLQSEIIEIFLKTLIIFNKWGARILVREQKSLVLWLFLHSINIFINRLFNRSVGGSQSEVKRLIFQDVGCRSYLPLRPSFRRCPREPLEGGKIPSRAMRMSSTEKKALGLNS